MAHSFDLGPRPLALVRGWLLAAFLLARAAGLGATAPTSELDPIAEAYVKLALAAVVHDPDFVDAYQGPAAWQEAATAAKLPLADIVAQARDQRGKLAAINPARFDAMGQLRYEYLAKQLQAMEARLHLAGGHPRPFDEESRELFDAVSPHQDAAHYDAVLAELDAILPAGGALAERYQTFRNRYLIPADKLDAVFRAALAAARERTRQHIALPANESFVVEYVTGKPWGGYNWYKGDYRSLIQVNTDLPIFIDRALDLACHEGYPGHHVYNVLLEKNLLRDRGWIEFSVYALFSPQSLIAEGSANYGIEVAFPHAERLAFERDVLFPLAGLDPKSADDYYRVLELAKKLSFAGNEAARRHLDQGLGADETAAWLTRYTLQDAARARKQVRFIDQYRSYVINYNLGQKLVRDFIEGRAQGDSERRWREFADLISSPRLPSGLK